MTAEIVIDGRDLELAGRVSGLGVVVEVDQDFDPSDASTWTRYSEATPEGGELVLVRYPEGYGLRHHGVTVWQQMAGC